MSVSKSDIRFIRSLDKKSERDRTGVFIIEGDKLYKEALESGWIIERTLYRDVIGEDMMSRISHLSSPSPVLAIVSRPVVTDTLIPERGQLYLALDSVRDPGNMGTIIRLCDWFGVKALYCSPDCVDAYNPKVVQSTMGSIFRVNIHYTDLKHFISENCSNIPIYGTFLNGENIYTESLTEEGIIILGSESFGISQDLEMLSNKRLHIPSFNKGERAGESLNVATAAAIVCSEFRRISALPPQII